MMNRPSLFDELIFAPASLITASADRYAAAPSLSLQLRTSDARRNFSQPVPLFSRRPPVAPDDALWPAYCGLLKSYGVSLSTPVQSLETLSVANVPVRFSRRAADEPLSSHEIETADAIELTCRRSQIAPDSELSLKTWLTQPTLPLECKGINELRLLVTALRDMTGGGTPIGLGLVAGNASEDIAAIATAEADFVLLEFPETSEEGRAEQAHLLWSVASAAKALRNSSSAMPLLVDAPVHRVDHIAKLLALGASAVSVDALFAPLLQSGPKPVQSTSKGMLSGIGTIPTKPVPVIAPAEQKLKELLERLRQILMQTRVAQVRDLTPQHLRALSSQAADLTAVARLD